MSENSVPAGRFLARVEFLKDLPSRFARLRPLYQIDDQPWCPVEDDGSRFPDEGSVFWWRPPSTVADDTLWVVTLDSQQQYGSDQRHKDRYQVAEYWRPYQAMAIYGVNGHREFRRVLASGRLPFESLVIGRPLVRVPGEGGHWIELPETFTTSDQKSQTLVTVSGLEGVIPVYSINAESFQQVVINRRRYSLLLDPGIPSGYQCVSSDVQLVEHLRKRISKLDRNVLDGLNITKNLLQHYVDVIEAVGLGGDEAAKEAARRDAATTLIEGLDAEVAHLDEVVGILMEHPRIAKALEARYEEELRRRREQWEHELAQEHRAIIDDLTTKKEEIGTTRQELATLRAGITTAVDDILDAPFSALARHGLLDSLRRSLRMDVVRSQPSTIDTPFLAPIETITEITRLKEAIGAWSYGTGVDPYVIHVALASVLAHRITLLTGANAERLAIALASTFAGDRAVRVSVGTAIFGLADLMNAPVSPVGLTRFDRIPTLGDFLSEHAAQASVAVILSGCNRAPPEVVLSDLLLPLGDGSSVLAWSSRDVGHLTTVALSPRVRIIGTLHGGEATYRIAANLSRQLGLVPADRREIKGIVMPARPIPLPSRIDPALWDSLQMTHEAADLGAWVGWLVEHGVGLPVDTLQRVSSTYLHFLGDPQRAITEAIAGLLLGRGPIPEFSDLPGTNGEWVRQQLWDLSQTTACQEAACYFSMGYER